MPPHLSYHLIASHHSCSEGWEIGCWANTLTKFDKADGLYKESWKNRIHLWFSAQNSSAVNIRNTSGICWSYQEDEHYHVSKSRQTWYDGFQYNPYRLQRSGRVGRIRPGAWNALNHQVTLIILMRRTTRSSLKTCSIPSITCFTESKNEIMAILKLNQFLV